MLHEHGLDAIVNFAAESHVDRSIDGPARIRQDECRQGTFTLLEAARILEGAGGTAQAAFRFLHVSTDEVYGSLGPTMRLFTETTPYSPNSPYSASKAARDHFVRAYHHTYGFRRSSTNCSNNYGPYQFPEKLIPLMIINALEGKPLPVYGDGQNVRDWLYVEDHCRGDSGRARTGAHSARPTTSAASASGRTSRSCKRSVRPLDEREARPAMAPTKR